jgi:IS5 family transposase
MGYKQTEPNMTFAEVSLLKYIEHNRSLKRLEKINQGINWSQVEEILLSHYTVGSSREGTDAYPPLMLLKGLLLQKWYRIDSHPERENQLNDRISCKKFMGLSFDQHSPRFKGARFCGHQSRACSFHGSDAGLGQ